MTRIIGEHFRFDGKPKAGYRDKHEARLAAEEYGKQHYQCEFCGEWHIGGHGPKPKKY